MHVFRHADAGRPENASFHAYDGMLLVKGMCQAHATGQVNVLESCCTSQQKPLALPRQAVKEI